MVISILNVPLTERRCNFCQFPLSAADPQFDPDAIPEGPMFPKSNISGRSTDSYGNRTEVGGRLESFPPLMKVPSVSPKISLEPTHSSGRQKLHLCMYFQLKLVCFIILTLLTNLKILTQLVNDPTPNPFCC